jgi:pSer/pThr/pTyr-binding forkhead associated (FHA) protein
MVQSTDDLPVLIGQGSNLDGQRWVIEEQILIGRDATCDIVIPQRQVSRQHARFKNTADGVVVEDLGSRNGTFYNGHVMDTPILLGDGDSIQIALAQHFIYLSSDATLPLDFSVQPTPPKEESRLQLDHRSRRVWIGAKELTPPLSVAQFTMLELLYRRDGRVLSREEIIREVWGEEGAFEVSNQALDALVRRLRDRLAEADSEQKYIVTVRGHGLRLDNPKG